MTPRILVATRLDPLAPRPQPLQVLSTAAGMARAGADVTVVMDGPGGATRAQVEAHLGRPLGDGVELILVRGEHVGLRGLRRRIELARLLRRPWDAVLTRDFKLNALVDRLRRGPRPPPLIHEWHSVPSALGQGGEGEELAARAANGHVHVSTGLYGFVTERFGLSRVPATVLPNGCWLDDDRASACIEALAGARKVLTTGLFRQPDDGDLLVRVARTLAPGFELVVAGAAPAALDGVEGVTTHGTVSPARIPDLWPGSLCQLALYRDDLNTRRFASPLKVVAAMASGVPLIATDLPTVRTLVEHEHSALLVGPGDTDGVIRAIARLDDDPALARALATHAVEAARELTWERRGEGLLAFVAGL